MYQKVDSFRENIADFPHQIATQEVRHGVATGLLRSHLIRPIYPSVDNIWVPAVPEDDRRWASTSISAVCGNMSNGVTLSSR